MAWMSMPRPLKLFARTLRPGPENGWKKREAQYRRYEDPTAMDIYDTTVEKGMGVKM